MLVSDRRPPEITESIAEALRAGLALIAVVLIARANVGALTRGPSAWVAWPVCLFVWGAAAGAAHWSRLAHGSRLFVWRDCVAPALVTLLMAGSGGGSGSLAAAIVIVMIGSIVVGLAATCGRANLCERSVVTMDAMSPPTTPQVDSPSSSPEPIIEREEEPPLVECTLPATPALAPVAATPPPEALPAEINEIVDNSVEDSSPAESWTRMESDGEVSIEAVVLARFIEGSKLAVVHLPFIPPLPAVPQIECEPLDSGCEVTIKTEGAYRHGARLSVTRQSAGPAESVPIGVVVYTSAEERVEL